MRRSFFNRSITLALVVITGGLPIVGQAQTAPFPNKPVRIIVPATPGGSSDVFARAIAVRLQEALKQPVIVEYKAGAGTNIGSDFVAKSAPDGHTLLINGIIMASNPSMNSNMAFSPTKDLAAVIEVAEIPNVFTAHPSLQVNSMKELVELAKKEPNKLNYGTPGPGSSGHLSGELLGLKTGAMLTHIPYQGNAQATADHIGGTLQVGIVNLPVAVPFVKAGRLKPLAVTSRKRSPLMPDVPTVAESLGVPDYELSGWFGIFAPARTPPEIVARLQDEINRLMKDASFVDIIKTAGGEISGGSSAQLDAKLKKDTERLSELIKLTGMANK
jgi:tripartite-type tricarboxylate transporter receptor subunit TctC